MDNSERRILADVRLAQAKECLVAAQVNIDADSYKTSANRSYYAIFHAMRAILALDNFDSKKHSGIISTFRQQYIKTGKFEGRFSKIITGASLIRNKSDYDDFYIAEKSKISKQLEDAKEFLLAVEKYIAHHENDCSNETDSR